MTTKERSRPPAAPPITHGVSAATTPVELLQHAQSRPGWSKLTPLHREQATEVFLAAECPALNGIALDNQALRKQLDLSEAQWWKLARALKDARFLDVRRRWSGMPGKLREDGPASWLYAPTENVLPSQLPRKRKRDHAAEIRSLRSEVATLRDDMLRRDQAAQRAIAMLQEHHS
jgi:hypothetical protein